MKKLAHIIKQDIQANRKDPLTILPLMVYRLGNHLHYRFRVPVLKQLLWVLYRILYILVIRICSQACFPATAKVGARLRLPHGMNGIVVHANAELGDDVTLFHQVTIGTSSLYEDNGNPVIGNKVAIGAGAKVLGPIVVEDEVKIGANAVLVKSVPRGATVIGIAGLRIIEAKGA